MFPDTTRVLVVDDMPSMRQLVKQEARRLGLKHFTEAENGEVAWQVIETQHISGQPIELILSDWNMPVLSGIKLLERVRKTPEYSHLPFVLITAEGEQHQVLEAIKLKVSQYLVKPFTPATFKRRIEAVWAKHSIYLKGMAAVEAVRKKALK